MNNAGEKVQKNTENKRIWHYFSQHKQNTMQNTSRMKFAGKQMELENSSWVR